MISQDERKFQFNAPEGNFHTADFAGPQIPQNAAGGFAFS
jgi:hypothetical protein